MLVYLLLFSQITNKRGIIFVNEIKYILWKYTLLFLKFKFKIFKFDYEENNFLLKFLSKYDEELRNKIRRIKSRFNTFEKKNDESSITTKY